MWQIASAFIAGALLAGIVAWRLGLHFARRQSQKERRLLRRTRRAERLAELGKLTGTLAHEIRNPLSTVKLNLTLLAEDITSLARSQAGQADCTAPTDEIDRGLHRQLRRIETISKETDRLADTLNDFLRYAGRMELHPQRHDVNELLDDLIDFYEPQAVSNNVTIRRSLSKNPAFCMVDPDLLKRAILNIFINAIQAMPDGGELMIRSYVRAHEFIIEIIDTGPGIPADKQDEIFEAYYTTKPGGTGLGLPICRRIIEEHDGHIELHSDPGKGSSFTIALNLLKE